MAKLRREKQNVCLITQDERLVGIFTDRDVMRKIAGEPDLLDTPVDQVMTRDPIAIRADVSAAEALRIMDEKHFRNLPVVDGDSRILGSMTHRAIIDWLAARYPIEVLNLPPNLERFPRKPEGG